MRERRASDSRYYGGIERRRYARQPVREVVAEVTDLVDELNTLVRKLNDVLDLEDQDE